MRALIYLNQTLWDEHIQYPAQKDARHALGLLEDDNQLDNMLAEAAFNYTACIKLY